MTTIYQNISNLKDHHLSGDDVVLTIEDHLNSIIISNLVNLLNLSCGIDLSDVDQPFTKKLCVLDYLNDPEISYDFKYGEAFVTLDSKTHLLNVSFYFSNNGPNYLHKNIVCWLDVSHDMEFKQAAFKRIFEYTKRINTTFHDNLVWAAFIVYTVIDKSLNKTHQLNYQNNRLYAVDQTNLVDLFDKELHPFFKSPPVDFDELLFIFLNFIGDNPKEFYEVFPEHPSYPDLVGSVDSLIQSLELFYQQYSYDKELLKNKLSLLEMSLI